MLPALSIAGDLTFNPPWDGGGKCYVSFGRNTGFPASLDLFTAPLNGNDGFRIEIDYFGTHIGKAVSSAGDINGDGADDLIIGAPRYDSDDGRAYVVFGRNLDRLFRSGFEQQLSFISAFRELAQE